MLKKSSWVPLRPVPAIEIELPKTDGLLGKPPNEFFAKPSLSSIASLGAWTSLFSSVQSKVQSRSYSYRPVIPWEGLSNGMLFLRLMTVNLF